MKPSSQPSQSPSCQPSSQPSIDPTNQPTSIQTSQPSNINVQQNMEIARSHTVLQKLIDNVSESNTFKVKKKIVDDFMNEFEKSQNRRPQKDEVYNHLKDKMDSDILKRIVKDIP
jgi:hypothetical protein